MSGCFVNNVDFYFNTETIDKTTQFIIGCGNFYGTATLSQFQFISNQIECL